jgi:hypothetical protein
MALPATATSSALTAGVGVLGDLLLGRDLLPELGREQVNEVVDLAGACSEHRKVAAGGVLDVLGRVELGIGKLQRRNALAERRARGGGQITHQPSQRDGLCRRFRMGAPHIGDVLRGEADHHIRSIHVVVGELVAAVHRPFRAELGNRVARSPAHGHAFNDMRPGRRDS